MEEEKFSPVGGGSSSEEPKGFKVKVITILIVLLVIVLAIVAICTIRKNSEKNLNETLAIAQVTYELNRIKNGDELALEQYLNYSSLLDNSEDIEEDVIEDEKEVEEKDEEKDVAEEKSKTEVSKDAASMILSDDNFATIIKAVANGRTVYANIKNTILFLLSGNLAAILTVLFTSFAGLSVPFKAVQLLFINLVTDSLPALAIGMEPDEGEVLKAAPRDPKANLMDKSFNIKMILQGALISVVVVVAYLIGHKVSPAMACTMAFLTLTMARLFHGFNCRGKGSLIKLGFRKNPYSLGAFLIGTILVALSVFTVVGRNLFAVSVLGKTEIIQILGLAVAPTVLVQIIKIVKENIK